MWSAFIINQNNNDNQNTWAKSDRGQKVTQYPNMLPITAGNHSAVTGVFVLSFLTAVDKIKTVVSSSTLVKEMYRMVTFVTLG